MKTKGFCCLKYTLPIVGLLGTLANSEIQAGTMGSVEEPVLRNVYLGVFGGGGSSTDTDLIQYGNAFFSELESIGPLDINAFGSGGRRDVGLVGGQIGYQWAPTPFFHSSWTMTPAFELEGYYLGKGKFVGSDLINGTNLLEEHDFSVSLPMNSSVFLANAIINLNPAMSRWHPYLGVGIGAAVLSIHGATSFQESPPELGVNHFDGNPNDTTSTFAAQGKLGLQFDLSQCWNLFVEYRGLYLTNSQFTFGGTVAASHVPTSSWQVKVDSQYYNLGAAGVKFTF